MWRVERRDENGGHGPTRLREVYRGPETQAREHFERIKDGLVPGECVDLHDSTNRLVHSACIPKIRASHRRPR